MNTDVVIIGAGPSGIFTAMELIRRGSKRHITIVEKGNAIENRFCPKVKTKKCMNCKPYCHITTGFSGAGAFSDGKLSLSCEVGGDSAEPRGREPCAGADRLCGSRSIWNSARTRRSRASADPEAVKEIRRRAIQAGLKLVDCPIRHLGTEKAQEIYYAIEQYLLENGVEIIFGRECVDLVHGGRRLPGRAHPPEGRGARASRRAHRDRYRQARRGLAGTHLHRAWRGASAGYGGHRRARGSAETRSWKRSTRCSTNPSSSAIRSPFKNKVRTFCQNPGGFVSQENYDNNLAVVNGHSYKELKSNNTNLAILCSHNFSVPFNQPIAYAQKVGELTNMLANGHILVQRFGDILDGKRTWEKELVQSNVKPTLPDAVAGDITAAMPYRAMTNIIAFIQAMDQVVPGFASHETLLYSPELKFYSNRIKMDARAEHLHSRSALPGRLQRLDARPDDGQLHGRGNGAPPRGC